MGSGLPDQIVDLLCWVFIVLKLYIYIYIFLYIYVRLRNNIETQGGRMENIRLDMFILICSKSIKRDIISCGQLAASA